MRSTTAGLLASLATLATASTDSRTFAVLRFNGDGFMTEGRVDPIVNPGAASGHLHGIMGGSNFGTTVEGDQLLASNCTSTKIKNDKSNYWVPEVYFNDPNNGTFTKVPLFYMNVYYFFEPTDDEIKPFPVGLKMVIGNATTRDPPAFGGANNLDPNAGPIQPVQFTCPRSSYTPASYPAGSDGTSAGIQDPNNLGAGAGFPLYPCDGYASPLRSDIHFPSCYNPSVGLDDYKNNMAWPTSSNGKQNCPSGYIHVPHIFYELYWNTPLFNNLWTPDGKKQPFVLSNGDRTGFSLHGDFISGWDQDTLQTIINTCNAGDSGMDQCPTIPGGLNTVNDCHIKSEVTEALSLTGALVSLPGNNPLSGWGVSGVVGGGSGGSGTSSSSGSSATSATATGGSVAAYSQATAASQAVASSTSEYPVNVGGQTTVGTSIVSASAVLAEVTASSSAVVGSPTISDTYDTTAAAGGYPVISTVWDIVTVTETTTVYATETGFAKRHVHEHKARHLRAGHARR